MAARRGRGLGIGIGVGERGGIRSRSLGRGRGRIFTVTTVGAGITDSAQYELNAAAVEAFAGYMAQVARAILQGAQFAMEPTDRILIQPEDIEQGVGGEPNLRSFFPFIPLPE
jgi:hypothetical protein